MKTPFNLYGPIKEKIHKEKNLFVLMFAFFICFFPINSKQDDYTTPISHVLVPTTHISRGELWAIFSLSIGQWDTGQRITVVLYSTDNQIQKAFFREHFGVNVYRFQEMINGKINTGRVIPPIIVENEQQMIKEISRKPGRIGFVRTHVLLGEYDGIKQIKIN